MSQATRTMEPATRVLATDAAGALLGRLEAEHGPISLHVSGSYGVTILCLPAGGLKLGSRDIALGSAAGVPLYMMTSEIDYWRGSTLVVDVAVGRPQGFSLESPHGIHFTLRKHVNPAKRVWDANAYLTPLGP